MSELYDNQNLKLNGTYTINSDGTLTAEDGTTHTISFSGTTPTGGNLNYENNILTSGCIAMDEYKVTIENGEVTNAEKGKCQSISLTACDSVNFNPSPENWFNFDSSTGTITGFSDAWDGTTDITIPCQIGGVDVVNIGSGALANKNLTSVVISDSVVTINAGGFAMNGLYKLIIGANVETIDMHAFQNSNLKELIIPNNVKLIGVRAFRDNHNLVSLKLGTNLETIGEEAFIFCNLNEIIIPNNVKNIGMGAFSNNQIYRLTLGNKVETIGNGAFINNQLTEISMPNSVTNIGSGAFAYNKLIKITIPNSVTVIGPGAFQSNPNLTTIYNNSGGSFDWGMAINGGTTATEYIFETGKVDNEYGDVLITKSN